jgi:ABC-2 type transport system permease protein
LNFIGIIAARELKSLFLSPLGWGILGVVQAVAAYLFLSQVQRFLAVQDKLAAIDNAPGFTALIIPAFFTDAGIILLLATPLLTMRSISEERRNKTLTLLQAAPLSSTQIVLGKALGVFAFVAVVAALISLMPATLAISGALDFGMLAANVVALLLLGALFVSAGLLVSCLTRYPALAAIGATGLLLLLWLLDWRAGMAQADNPLLQYLSLLNHFQNLQSGLVDSSDILYFIVGTAAFLILSVYQLEKRRLQP